MAELHLRNRSFQQCAECVTKGLQVINENGHRRLSGCVLTLLPSLALVCSTLLSRLMAKLQFIQAEVFRSTKGKKEAQELYLSLLTRDEKHVPAMMVCGVRHHRAHPVLTR